MNFGLIILNQSIGTMQKLCYTDTDSFTIHIKTEYLYKDIVDNVEKKFDTSNYEVKRPLPKGKNKKVNGLVKDKLGRKITTIFVALRPKTYSYSMEDDNSDKRAMGTKKYVIKRELKFINYENCNKATQLDNIIKYLEKTELNTDVLEKNYEEFIKNNKLMLKHNKDLKVKTIMFLLKRLIRLL